MKNQSMDKCKRNKHNAKKKKNAFGHCDCNICQKIIVKPIVWPLKKYCNQRSDGWFVLVQKMIFFFALRDVGAHFLCSLTWFSITHRTFGNIVLKVFRGY